MANESQNPKAPKAKKAAAPKKPRTAQGAKKTEIVAKDDSAKAAIVAVAIEAPTVTSRPAEPKVAKEGPTIIPVVKPIRIDAVVNTNRVEPAKPTRSEPVKPSHVFDGEDDYEEQPGEAEDPNAGKLSLQISRALYFRMKYQAKEEGLTLEEFATELLAEGAVLRAWEIIEKKSQMRGISTQGNGPTGPNRNNSHQSGNRHNNAGGNNQNSGGNRKNGPRGMSQSRYQSIMDDKANFLEYVRSQERNRR